MVAVVVLPISARAAITDELAISERSMGADDAPVTLIEYSSMTCPHCATFHDDTLPKLKKAFIDTGKVRYIFRDFPLESRAMAAAMTARCVDPQRYFGFVDLIYKDQQDWSKSSDPMKALQTRAQLAGLSENDFASCLDNRTLFEAIQNRAQSGEAEFGIESTPTLLSMARNLAAQCRSRSSRK
ncbi:MAG: thioredoxin domain-containing protein [Rhodospirillales bacterium]|nr:thioredoxin domain-containing protein [Rhodospirillales bacterium]